jgi:hypothetical protein
MSAPSAASATPVVYDSDEAAALLRCRASWLKEKARRREIPFTMIGGSYRWTADHLAEIVRMGEQEPSASLRQAPRRLAPHGADTGMPSLRARAPRRARAPDMPAAGPAPPEPADKRQAVPHATGKRPQ